MIQNLHLLRCYRSCLVTNKLHEAKRTNIRNYSRRNYTAKKLNFDFAYSCYTVKQVNNLPDSCARFPEILHVLICFCVISSFTFNDKMQTNRAVLFRSLFISAIKLSSRFNEKLSTSWMNFSLADRIYSSGSQISEKRKRQHKGIL